MRKRTKALIAIVASAICVLMFAGVAYGTILSDEEHTAHIMLDADATPMNVEQTLPGSYDSDLEAAELNASDDERSEIADATSIEQSAEAESGANDSSTTTPEDTSESIADAMVPLAPTPRTLSILGNTIPYVDSYNTSSAPSSTAGIWAGNESTTDGSWAYFVGHHPGVFNCVMDLQNGDAIQVCDNCGNTHTYHVIEVYDIPNYTQWEEIADDVVSHGESITLQTCCGDNQHYHIVEAV